MLLSSRLDPFQVVGFCIHIALERPLTLASFLLPRFISSSLRLQASRREDWRQSRLLLSKPERFPASGLCGIRVSFPEIAGRFICLEDRKPHRSAAWICMRRANLPRLFHPPRLPGGLSSHSRIHFPEKLGTRGVKPGNIFVCVN
ncbi:unnamed protein product [Pipistrellus nathusii]|uniref:Uncharacterized protein n=1 Tax=Pipistrellus nathusii TaxID=59473 RepID=A0ABP0A312_PIPNA